MDKSESSTGYRDQPWPPTEPTASRLFLRNIRASRENLLGPPNTAEAFLRLEAALDEVKRQSLVHQSGPEEGQLLDPPDTAERFFRIETAIDELLLEQQASLSPNSRIPTRHRHIRERSVNAYQQEHHRLKKRTTLAAEHTSRTNPRPSNASDIGSENARPIITGHELESDGIPNVKTIQPPRDMYGPSKYPGRTAEGTHVSARTVPLPQDTQPGASFKGKEMFEQEMDIFRSADAMEEFMRQAFYDAREKYM